MSQTVQRLTWLVVVISLLLAIVLAQADVTIADLLHAGGRLLAQVRVGWLLTVPVLWWAFCRRK